MLRAEWQCRRERAQRPRQEPPAAWARPDVWEALGLSKRERERILARFISAGLAKRREGDDLSAADQR